MRFFCSKISSVLLQLFLGFANTEGAFSARSVLVTAAQNQLQQAAMLVAGIFGTVVGDFTAHSIGLYAAAGLLVAALLALLAVRAWVFPGAMLAYWVAVLAERCAGTPVGDALASRHADNTRITAPPISICHHRTLVVYAPGASWWLA